MRSVAGVAAKELASQSSTPSIAKPWRHSLRHGLIALSVALASGCSLLPEQIDNTAGWSAARLYSEAKTAMEDSNWEQAVKYYQKLESRYPYGRFAQQAQIETAYAYWKDGDTASAIAACDRFIKLHPNHPHVDYMYYLKGLINFNEDLGFLSYLNTQDQTERDPKAARAAFETFKELVQRFPKSKYTSDALQRMNYLVNALSAHEVHVAHYYYKRGAYIAAANRSQFAVQNYPNTPSQEKALFLMVKSYEQLGMEQLRADAERVMRLNYPESIFFTDGLERKKPWWQVL